MNQAPSFMNSMNMGGGVGASNKSARLLAGLRDELTKIQPIIDKVVQSTQKIAENLTKAKNAGSLGFSGSGGGNVTSLGFVADGGGMSFQNFVKGLKTAGAIGLTAATQAINLEEMAENSLARSRMGFFSGQGSAAAAMSFQGMMRQGTATSTLDAARAQLVGASSGLMPSLPGFANVEAGAATFSNLVPGAGLAGGMQAMAALNQAPNVNRLRMIGIQVRDPSTGTMRSPEAIAGDLWNKLNAQKTGSSSISKRDIAISLQSGNALDMMLNQYFGNDPILRQGIVTALMQKAGGGDLSRESLIASGALPELAASTGERYSAAYGAVNAYTGAAETGIIAGNKIVADAANVMRDAADIFSGAVSVFAGVSTVAGGGNGALGTLGGGLIGAAGNFGSMLLAGKMLGIGGRGGGMPKFGGAGKLLPALGKAAPGVAGVVGGVTAFDNASKGGDLDLLSVLLTTAASAGIGFLTGGPGGALLGGSLALGGTLAGHFAGKAVSGEGDGAESAESAPTSYNPLDRLDVNAAYLKKRDYLIDGKPPANLYHTGVDFNANVGDPVYAVKDGTVVPTSYAANGFGNSVKIKHGDGHTSIYAHLSQKAVSSGSVKAGQLIGYAGDTGLSSGPHLHFEVRKSSDDQSTHVDPMAYLAGSSTPSGATPISATEGNREATAGLLGSLSSGIALLPGLAGAPSPNGEGGEGGYGSTTNYGGVTVNINVPKGANINEQNLAKEIKKVLSSEEMLKKAVSR